MEKIHLKITTKSNLMIGGAPASFEIGGIDAYTVVDFKNYPFIPASSMKGSLRRIVGDMEKANDFEAEKIRECYREYLQELCKKNEELLKEKMEKKLEDERVKALRERFKESISKASALYLFGIQGFNMTPRLIFNDFVLPEDADIQNVFSIDAKNTIYYSEDAIEANPRMYQTVRPGVVFFGEIGLYQMEELKTDCVKSFVERAAMEYNNGIYRLGNSGSRGYGRICVCTNDCAGGSV